MKATSSRTTFSIPPPSTRCAPTLLADQNHLSPFSKKVLVEKYWRVYWGRLVSESSLKPLNPLVLVLVKPSTPQLSRWASLVSISPHWSRYALENLNALPPLFLLGLLDRAVAFAILGRQRKLFDDGFKLVPILGKEGRSTFIYLLDQENWTSITDGLLIEMYFLPIPSVITGPGHGIDHRRRNRFRCNFKRSAKERLFIQRI